MTPETWTTERLTGYWSLGDLVKVGYGHDPTYRNPQEAWVKVVGVSPESSHEECSTYTLQFVAMAHYAHCKPPAHIVALAAQT